MKRLLMICVAMIAVAGCSTVGPYVTNISSDGNGNVVVEKSMIEYNGLLGTFQSKDVTTSTIKIFNEK